LFVNKQAKARSTVMELLQLAAFVGQAILPAAAFQAALP
jgi:hypothetical protein